MTNPLEYTSPPFFGPGSRLTAPIQTAVDAREESL
jgi:hypothetical protein